MLNSLHFLPPMLATLVLATARPSLADALHDWNDKANEIVVASRLSPPPAFRVTAITQTAVYEAVDAITRRYGAAGVPLQASAAASIDAAIAAAHRAALSSCRASSARSSRRAACRSARPASC